jgi:hypothetical protein
MLSARQDELTTLAIELEALANAGALDGAAVGELLAACAGFGPIPMIAGLLLFFCGRAEPEQAEKLWQDMDKSARPRFQAAMIALHASGAVKVLGAKRLAECLCADGDYLLHERVARAVCATAVVGSEALLSCLTGLPRDMLAFRLAQRLGGSTDSLPTWLDQLNHAARKRALAGFALGAALAGCAPRFAVVVATFDAECWRIFAAALRVHADTFDTRLCELLAPYRATMQPSSLGVGPAENLRRLPGSVSAEPVIASDSEQSFSFILQAATAQPEELSGLLVKVSNLQRPYWRREAQRAVLRRAIILRVCPPGVTCGLPRTVLIEEIIVARLTRGDMAVLFNPNWRRLDRHRRFTLLDAAIAALPARVGDLTLREMNAVVQAIAELPAPIGRVLAVKLADEVADCAALGSELLQLLAPCDIGREVEVLTAISRAYALRGEPVPAKKFMGLAKAAAERDAGDVARRRLADLLGQCSDFPVDRLTALMHVFAMAPDHELPGLFRQCQRQLSETASNILLAGMVARGRASAALAT